MFLGLYVYILEISCFDKIVHFMVYMGLMVDWVVVEVGGGYI